VQVGRMRRVAMAWFSSIMLMEPHAVLESPSALYTLTAQLQPN
jgi:hypothetical protein